ncbi:MerR family transcriptional regulator [Bradyrhizobium prioriisuperbiae]|uniref:MerR family transcriptional regulator n=1 Tax=Bradyrhizobium prioriisuperbiae TaxID=2854389 RepID=UPI0028F091B8|nr:MerR family transcriptional regulator [Bradyrhizobium prioritasuperba]
MRIGQLSQRSGVSVRMLRYYESQGLLQPQRTAAGYRLYAASDVDRVARITLLNKAGLTLASIRQVLPCPLPGAPGFKPCGELQSSVRQKLAELDRQIAHLTKSRRVLASYLGRGS